MLMPGGRLADSMMMVADDKGTILDLKEYDEKEECETIRGILCPGFINSHCHLELSHLKRVISPATGLNGFIEQIGATIEALDSKHDVGKAEIIALLEKPDVEVKDKFKLTIGWILKYEKELSAGDLKDYWTWFKAGGFKKLFIEE